MTEVVVTQEDKHLAATISAIYDKPIDVRLFTEIEYLLARHRTLTPAQAAGEVLLEALKRIRDHAQKLRKGTDDWFELVEIEAFASEAITQAEGPQA